MEGFQLRELSPDSFGGGGISGSFSRLQSHRSSVGVGLISTSVLVDDETSFCENTRDSTDNTCCSISFRNGKNESTMESNMP